MKIQRLIKSKSEYRNTKQIQIANAQIIEELRSPDKPGSSTSHKIEDKAIHHEEYACCCGSMQTPVSSSFTFDVGRWTFDVHSFLNTITLHGQHLTAYSLTCLSRP